MASTARVCREAPPRSLTRSAQVKSRHPEGPNVHNSHGFDLMGCFCPWFLYIVSDSQCLPISTIFPAMLVYKHVVPILGSWSLPLLVHSNIQTGSNRMCPYVFAKDPRNWWTFKKPFKTFQDRTTSIDFIGFVWTCFILSLGNPFSILVFGKKCPHAFIRSPLETDSACTWQVFNLCHAFLVKAASKMRRRSTCRSSNRKTNM